MMKWQGGNGQDVIGTSQFSRPFHLSFFFLNDRFTNDGFECHILLYNVDNLCI